MGESVRKCLWSVASACALLVALSPVSAHAEQVPVDAATLSKAAGSSLGQLQKVKLGSQGATITLGGQDVGFDISGLTGTTGGAGGGGNVMGMGMLFFGASVLTRLLSTIARIFRPRSRRERWIET